MFRGIVFLHFICAAFISLYFISYRKRMQSHVLKYQFCNSLDSCIVLRPSTLAKYGAAKLCNAHSINKCSGDNVCCAICLSKARSTDASSVDTVSFGNRYSSLVQGYVIIACLYFVAYFVLLCLKTTRCKTERLRYVKSIATGACLMLTALLLFSASLGLVIYLSFEWQIVKKCQSNLIVLTVWACVTSMAFLDFAVHLFPWKDKKPPSGTRNSLSVFSFLNFAKKFACVAFNKIMSLSLAFYVIVIVYFELLLQNVLSPVKI